MTSLPLADGVLVVADGPVPWALPAPAHAVDVAAADDLDGRAPLLGVYAHHVALVRSIVGQADGEPGLPPSIALARPDRFAVVAPVGRPTGTESVVSPTELAELTAAELRADPGTVVLPGVVAVPSVLAAAAAEDRAPDLLRVLAAAIACGVTDGAEVAGFLAHGALVDHPTVGVYPTAWYVQTVTALDQVATAFLQGRPDGPPPALEFGLTRLHALLLARLVATVPADGVLHHRPVVVRP